MTALLYAVVAGELGIVVALVALLWWMLERCAQLRRRCDLAELDGITLRGLLRSYGIAPPPPARARIE